MYWAPGVILVPSTKHHVYFLVVKVKHEGCWYFGVHSCSCSVKGSLQMYLESLFPLDTEA